MAIVTINTLHTTPAASAPAHIAPELFTIPARGQDPHFGLGRSSYYDLEKRGLLTLRRVRKPGNIRGRVLVPYAETAALIRRLSGEKGGNA